MKDKKRTCGAERANIDRYSRFFIDLSENEVARCCGK